MKLQKDARIFTPNGQEIGSLSRFVIDPRTKNITNIVFKRGLLTQDEYVIPMRTVDYVDQEGIHLQELPVENIEDLPMFLQEEFVVADERGLLQENYTSDSNIDTYYHYPSTAMRTGSATYPHDLYLSNPSGAASVGPTPGVPATGSQGGEPPIIRKTEQNIPEGTISLKEGSKVYSNDGKHIGDIERIFLNSDSGQATHLVISKGLLLKERKQIPVDWVEKILEDEVHLAVNAPFTERLPDFRE